MCKRFVLYFKRNNPVFGFVLRYKGFVTNTLVVILQKPSQSPDDLIKRFVHTVLSDFDTIVFVGGLNTEKKV